MWNSIPSLPKRAGWGTALFQIFHPWHQKCWCGGKPARQWLIVLNTTHWIRHSVSWWLPTTLSRIVQSYSSGLVQRYSAFFSTTTKPVTNMRKTCSSLPPLFVLTFKITTEYNNGVNQHNWMQSIGFPILNYAPLKPSHVFSKEMANSEWTWMERTWGIEACLTHIFTSQHIITLRHRCPGMRIVWVCGVCEHQPMNTQGKETVCGWFLYTECLAADFPHFSVGSSFENTGACSTPGRLSSDHPFSKRVVIFKSTGCLFQHFPHW